MRTFEEGSEPDKAFLEHSIVRAKADIVEGGTVIPAGSVGTIVHVHKGADAFEVEFPEFEEVIGAHRSEIEAA